MNLDLALNLVRKCRVKVWPLEEPDVRIGRRYHEQYPELQARDLCLLASCRRRGVENLLTFDVALREAADRELQSPPVGNWG